MATATDTTAAAIGKVIQIIGPAIDIEFAEGHLPAIHNAIRVVDTGEFGKVPIDVVVEVAGHIGENQVRCIAPEVHSRGPSNRRRTVPPVSTRKLCGNV